MDLQLKGKTALVTGTSQGIGRCIAKMLAAEGVKLCIAARRKNLLEELAKEIVAAGGIAPAIVETDIMQDGAPQKLADAAHAAWATRHSSTAPAAPGDPHRRA
jgi:3-oxoacyl-[acyl-carrier protein] reductase